MTAITRQTVIKRIEKILLLLMAGWVLNLG